MAETLDLDQLRRRLDSANTTILQQAREMEQLRIQLELLNSQRKQYLRSSEMQDQVIQKALDDANERSNRYLEEIQSLKDELKAARKG